MTPTTLKALAERLRNTAGSSPIDDADLSQAAAILESLASADEGVPVVAWLLLDQGMRSADDFEDYERVELAGTFPASELERFQKAGRADGLVRQSDHLAALFAQSTAADEMYEALRDMLAGWIYIRNFHGDLYGVGWDRAQDKAQAALAAHEAKHGGKG